MERKRNKVVASKKPKKSAGRKEKGVGVLSVAPRLTEETARLHVLDSYKILNTPPEVQFDDLTFLAANICQVPYALTCLAGKDRMWFKSKVGLTASEVPREHAFCATTLLQSDLFMVRDALTDERFATNSIVISELHVRFYAGVPLMTKEGYALGTLCVMDQVPRDLSLAQQEALKALGRQVMTQIEARLRDEERDKLLKQLEQSQGTLNLEQEKLESRVAERTVSLKAINTQLEDEISERQRTEEALQKSNTALVRSRDYYLTLFDEFPALIWRSGTDAKCDYFNKSWLSFRGRTMDQEQGAGWISGVHPDDRDNCMNTYLEAFEARRAFEMEYRLRRNDGEYRWIVDIGKPFYDLEGVFSGYLGSCYDLTERKQAEGTLQQSEHAIRVLYDITSDQSILFEERAQALLAMGCRRFRLPLGILARLNDDEFEVVKIHSSGGNIREGSKVPLCDSFCQSLLETDGPISIQHAGGSDWKTHPGYIGTKWEAYLGMKIMVSGRIYGTICFASPQPYQGTLTEADKNFLQLMARWIGGELERQQAEVLLQSIVEGTASTTGTEFFDSLVKHLARALGLKYAFIAECIDSTPPKIRTLSFWDGNQHSQNAEFVLAGTPCERVVRGEIVYHPKGVQALYTTDPYLPDLGVESYLGIPCFSTLGQIIGHIAVLDDKPMVTGALDMSLLKIFASRAGAELERKHGEEALAKSEERYRALYDQNPSMYFTLTPNGTVLSVNRFGAFQLGYSEEELIGQSVQKVIYKDDIEKALRHIEECLQHPGKLCQWEFRKVCKNGSMLWVKEAAHAVENSDGATVILIVCEDITERKQAEEARQESYKQLRELTRRLEVTEEEERKRIARELHDELGQVLTGLKFDLAWLSKQSRHLGGPSLSDNVESRISSMSALLDQTIHSVQKMARSLRPSLLDDLGLVAALEWQAQDFQNRTGVDCDLTVDSQIGQVQIGTESSMTLFRVVQEILTNVARHAEASLVLLSLERKGDWLILKGMDNGKGISEEQIVNPTSLGLIGMRERVSLLGGTFTIQGIPRGGTSISVRVPEGSG